MTAEPHPRTRWWSGLTPTRFLRSGIQQRVGGNALHPSQASRAFCWPAELRPSGLTVAKAQQDCAPTQSPDAAAQQLETQANSARGRAVLWLCVGAAFAVLIGAWVVMFKVAHATNIQEIKPAAKSGIRP